MPSQTVPGRTAGEQLTRQQLEAISSMSDETLVSAAAGSGKTHVLTKRIEALVRGADLDNFADDDGTFSDPDRMQDIRSMLVVTFTRTAATEMRTRIVRTLTDAADRQLENGNPAAARQLHEQAEAAAGADISTFHSFCSRVLSENYELAGLAAGFGILGDDQSGQIMGAVVRDMLDELYEKHDPRAERLLPQLSRNGNDTQLAAQIIRIYNQMMSTPDWKEWLTRSLHSSIPVLEEQWEQTRKDALARAVRTMNRVVDLMDEHGQGDALEKKRKGDVKLAYRLEETLEDAEKKGCRYAAAKLKTVPRMSSTEKMGGALETAQALRQKVKEDLGIFLDDRFDDPDQTAEDLKAARASVRDLTDLVCLFHEKYTQRKQTMNRVDYADLEHRTLAVLRELNRQGSGLGARYRHIFVDEYQDTNQVQEEIIRQLAGESRLFMVGDLKQSIYGFRFADPEIFRRKDAEFDTARGAARRSIHMNDNFRSSDRVIQATNAIMRSIMTDSVGGVDYTESQELVLGRRDARGGRAEILIADAQRDSGGGEAMSKAAAEAEMIADRIERLVAAGRMYGDIAVLTRSRSDRISALEAALERKGIPYSAELDNERSYTEIDLFLNLLELIVNERQDVPLLSVMRSYMFGFDDGDFARIARWSEAHEASPKEEEASRTSREPFFAQTMRFRQAARRCDPGLAPEDLELASRLEDFFADLGELRTMGTDMPLARFAEEVASHHDFAAYLLTRPGGGSRKAAFEQLLSMISGQQEIHGNSLYRVLKAVRELREGSAVSPPAQTIPEAVRLMTIHRSKGLEFPVVFLSGLDARFNTRSIGEAVLATNAHGVVMDCIDTAGHVRTETIETALVRASMRAAQRSEELRALYVVMTRAREELYLCGASQRNLQAARAFWNVLPGRFETADTMMDWIMGAHCKLLREWTPAKLSQISTQQGFCAILERAEAELTGLRSEADPVQTARAAASLRSMRQAIERVGQLYRLASAGAGPEQEISGEQAEDLVSTARLLLEDLQKSSGTGPGESPPANPAVRIHQDIVMLGAVRGGELEESLSRMLHANEESGPAGLADAARQLREAALKAARAAEEILLVSGAEDAVRDVRYAAESMSEAARALEAAEGIPAALRYDRMMKELHSGVFFRPAEHGNTEETEEKARPEQQAAKLLAEADAVISEPGFPGLESRARVPAVQGVSRRIQAERIQSGRSMPDFRERTVRPVLAEAEGISGAERGTLLHRALEYAVRQDLTADRLAAAMLEARLVTAEEAEEIILSQDQINSFLTSPLAQRAKNAGRLLTEQKFRVLIPADEAGTSGGATGRRIRLQGTIDMAFLEENAWVLVDYKSDRGVSGEELARRYAEQVSWYRLALEKTTGLPVREAYLFSLDRGEPVPVPQAG